MATRGRKLGTFGTIVFGLVFASVGFGGLNWYVAPKITKGQESLTWPKVQGSIVRSEVISERKRSNGKTKTMYHAEIAFTYHAGGRLYTNSTVDVGPQPSSSNSSSAYARVNKYRQGSKVTVYHNPQNPGESVLEPGVPSSLKWMKWLFIGALVVGVLCLGWMFLKGALLLVVLIAAARERKSVTA